MFWEGDEIGNKTRTILKKFVAIREQFDTKAGHGSRRKGV